ncbi:hypothetical protein D4764_07G0006570, partial [Takifugu flavidus]
PIKSSETIRKGTASLSSTRKRVTGLGRVLLNLSFDPPLLGRRGGLSQDGGASGADIPPPPPPQATIKAPQVNRRSNKCGAVVLVRGASNASAKEACGASSVRTERNTSIPTSQTLPPGADLHVKTSRSRLTTRIHPVDPGASRVPSSHWERGGITGRLYALNLQGSKCRHDNAARMLGETPSSEGEGAETAANTQESTTPGAPRSTARNSTLVWRKRRRNESNTRIKGNHTADEVMLLLQPHRSRSEPEPRPQNGSADLN